MDGACVPISFDLYSKHPVKFTQIGDFYMLSEACLELVDEAKVAGSNGAVVDMNCDDCDFVSGFVGLKEYSLVD